MTTYANSPLRAVHAMCGTDSGVLEAHMQATRSEPRKSLGLVAYCPSCEVSFKPEAVQESLGDPAQSWWDSDSRKSPYSTVADPSDDTYCEGCDDTVHYSPEFPNGRCRCDAPAGAGA